MNAGQSESTTVPPLQLAQAVGGVVGAGAALQMIPRPWQAKFGNYAHGVVPGSNAGASYRREGPQGSMC